MATAERGGVYEFVRESNRIENIDRPPTDVELSAHDDLWALDYLKVADIERFVADVAARPLREHVGHDVIVGNHRPPRGGPAIRTSLAALLVAINDRALTPWHAHCEYETLHPFIDGNGRSGRAIWAWQMLRDGRDPFRLGFLWAWYYQTLAARQ